MTRQTDGQSKILNWMLISKENLCKKKVHLDFLLPVPYLAFLLIDIGNQQKKSIVNLEKQQIKLHFLHSVKYQRKNKLN